MELFISLWSFLDCSFKHVEASLLDTLKSNLLAIVNIVQLNWNFYQYVPLSLRNICILKTSDALIEVLNQVFQLSKYCFSAQIHPFAHFVKMKICPLNTYFFFATWHYIKPGQEAALERHRGSKGLAHLSSSYSTCSLSPAPGPCGVSGFCGVHHLQGTVASPFSPESTLGCYVAEFLWSSLGT